MSDELQLWVRLVQNVAALLLVLWILTYCVGLWLEARRLYLAFAAAALLALVPLLLVRIADVPEPPLLPQDFIDVAGLVLNAIWPLFGLAWLATLLQRRWHANRLRKRLGLGPESQNGDG